MAHKCTQAGSLGLLGAVGAGVAGCWLGLLGLVGLVSCDARFSTQEPNRVRSMSRNTRFVNLLYVCFLIFSFGDSL